MKTALSLSQLSNSELLSQTKKLVTQERKLLASVLDHLTEVARRRLFAELGYSSLYDYAIHELGYSESAAHRRVASVRLMLDVPEVREKIEAGSLSLSVVAQAESFFRKEKTPSPEKGAVLERLENQSARQCERTLISLSANPESYRRPDRIRPVSETQSEIRFTAGDALLEKLEKIRGFLAHKNPRLSMAELIDEMARISLDQLDPARRGSKKKKAALQVDPDLRSTHPEAILLPKEIALAPTSVAQKVRPEVTRRPSFRPTSVPGKNSIILRERRLTETKLERARMGLPRKRLTVAAEVKSAVYQRDGGCCTYVSPQGRRCGSQFGVELDHIVEFARGGSNTAENLTLRCRTHNLWRAIQSYGWEKMDRYLTKPSKLFRCGSGGP